MAILIKGTDFSTGDQVTATNLDNLVDLATFDSGAVDNSTTQLSSGAIIVKDGGITSAKLATNIAVSGTLSAGAGTVGAPAFYLSSDTDSGLYVIGANNYGFAMAGAKVLDISTSGLAVTGGISGTTGTFTDLMSLTKAAGNRVLSINTGAIASWYDGTATETLRISGSSGNSLINAVTGNIRLQANASTVAEVSSTGLAVTGTLSSTGALTTNGGLQTFGANDSGGTGYRLVLVPNA